MNILFVTQYFAPEIGAAPVRLTALADALQEVGHEVTVLTSLPNYPGARTFDGYRGRIWATDRQASGVVIKRVWSFPAMGSGVKRYLNYLSFAVMAATRVWSVSKPDLILVESPPLTTSGVGWLLKRLRRAPLVLNVADLWPDAVVDLGLVDERSTAVRAARWVERWAYRQADLISYATRGIGDALKDKGIPASDLVFLPNGADTELFSPAVPTLDESEQRSDSPKTLLYAGTHSEAAAMEILIDVAEQLVADPRIRLLLVGDGPSKARLKSEAERRGLTNLEFRDPVQPSEVAALYADAVAGLVTLADNPMFVGTRPAKMFPPLACGRPVVYSGAGEGADLVTEHQLGLVTPPGDAEALADAIREIVDDPERASEMGANGRRFVEQNLSWSAIAGKWIAQVADRLQRAT